MCRPPSLTRTDTTTFVEDVIKALKSRSYAAPATAKTNGTTSQAAPIPSIVDTSKAEYGLRMTRATDTPPANAPKGPAAARASNAQHHLPDRPNGAVTGQLRSPSVNTQQDSAQTSKKRKLAERGTSDAQEGQDPHYPRAGTGNRPKKQTPRQGAKGSAKNLRGSAAVFEPQNTFAAFAPMPNMLTMANMPPPPPGPVPFDMGNPMAFFAMMAALGTTIPGMPPLPTMNQISGTGGQAHRAKCQDYHNKGFCALGSMCQFEHGETEHDIPEYDPDQPSLGTVPVPSSKGQLRPNRNINKSAKGGRPRAHFSLPGPSYDNTNTTLVVEQIPEENFSEDTIRDFFSQFGTIVEVQMSAYKRLAIVKFADHAAANEAYNSPKAVFENRFVKVYWYKHDSLSGASKGSNGDAEMPDGAGEALDLEAIAKRQAEAQKAFEERQRKMADAEARAAEIERLLKGNNEEMTKIKQQLAELAKDETDGTMEVQYANDLATLQAEAEGLFAENEALPPVGRGHGGPPRGAYQGAPRGRGYTPFPPRGRGASRGPGYRGRGGFHASFARGKSSVKRLDNRPRRLAVANIEKGTAKDEALRQYLVVRRRFCSCAIYTR